MKREPKRYRRLSKLKFYIENPKLYAEAKRVARRLLLAYGLRDLLPGDLISETYIALALGPKKRTGCGISGGGKYGRRFPLRISTRRVFLKAMESLVSNIWKWRIRHPHIEYQDDVADMDYTTGRHRGEAEEFHQRGFHREPDLILLGGFREDGWRSRRQSPTAAAFYDDEGAI